ncbi:hypothetical protein KI659_17300 [Litoribacter alkaliphilus]|uniref:Uncharacterized protein n=1 Tax=Litoribacter ruber TaxID=702568 RepID=A0AAP2CNH5_9BACT|nr:hypothetical protein [Litoribacter alkaliphilus]MBS9525780.1 hypothetical protein [Litoribacter alkaliphilus]
MMARVKSIISFEGSLFDTTFYQMNGKSYARQKKQSNKKDFLSKDSYKGSRRSCSEFGSASSFGGAFRRVLYPMISTINTGYFSSRLTALFRKVLKGDMKSDLGERKVLEGDLTLLKGLEVSTIDKVSLLLIGQVKATIDPALHQVLFDFSAVKRLNRKAFPAGATHYRIVPGVVMVGENPKKSGKLINPEFTENKFKEIGNPEREINRIIPFRQNYSNMLCCPVLGIYFYQQINGEFYELKTGAALQVVASERLLRPDLPSDVGRNWKDWIKGLASGILKG